MRVASANAQQAAATAAGHRAALRQALTPRPGVDQDEPTCPDKNQPYYSRPSLEGQLAVATTMHPDGRKSDRAPPSNGLVGKRVGRYVVDRLLGKGGMATVWRAVHEQLGGEVAIKVLAPEAVRGEEELERFFREAKVSAQLNHDHVVKVIDFARDPNVGSYIVMELLNGRGLDRVLSAEGPLEESRAVAFALQITDALAAAHAHGIVHRDLKPANIFVTKTLNTEIVKVMDFGIAKTPMSTALALTRPGEIYGTPLYMSPEQWDNADITEASDIYSFGIVLYEMLAGKPPLNGSVLTELVKNVVLREPPPLTLHRPNISPELDAIVLRCLRKQPSQRFANMRELREALERAQNRFDVTHTMNGAGLSGRRTARPRRPALFGFVTALGIGAVAAAATFAGVSWHRPLGLFGEKAPSAAVAEPTIAANTTHAAGIEIVPVPPPTATTVAGASAATPLGEQGSGPTAARPSTPTRAGVAPPSSMGRRARPGPSSTRPRETSPVKSPAAPPPDEDDLLRKE